MIFQGAEIRISLAALSASDNPVASGRFDPVISRVLAFVEGTGADEADLIWADEITIAASADTELDLSGGLTDEFGGAAVFAELVAIIVLPAEGNTNSVIVGGAASNAVPLFGDATDTLPCRPGGAYLISAPGAAGQCTVTAGTGDKLKLANSGSGTPVTAIVGLIGRTA